MKQWGGSNDKFSFLSFTVWQPFVSASQRVVHLTEEQNLDKGALDTDNSTSCSALLPHKSTKQKEKGAGTMCILFPEN